MSNSLPALTSIKQVSLLVGREREREREREWRNFDREKNRVVREK